MALRGPGAVTIADRKRMLALLESDPFPWMDKGNGMSRLDRVVNFLENLPLTMGEFAGQKMFLTTWQRDLVEKVMECDPKTGRRIIREILISMGRKNAKALALDTPIPTPVGWRKISAIERGDLVFGSDGKPCRVVDTSEVFSGKRCFMVGFSDGSSVVASEDHLWTTRHRYRPWATVKRTRSGNGGRPQVRTVNTDQLSRSVFVTRPDGLREHNHKIPAAPSLEMKDRALAIDPYTLGAWLGDGNSSDSRLTCFDLGILTVIRACGQEVRGQHKTPNAYCIVGLRPRLRSIGVLGNKHIPDVYFDASAADRWSLLQGLMDTDGTVARHCGRTTARCSFTNTRYALAYGVWRLARSLGLKATIREGRAKIDGRDVGPYWAVAFPASRQSPVFKLDRKQGLLPPSLGRRSGTLTVVSCDEVESVPTKCLTVDAADQLFLAGHGCVPTHNSVTGAGLGACWLFGPESEPRGEVVAAAVDKEEARRLFNEIDAMIGADERLGAFVDIKQHLGEIKVVHGQGLGSTFKVLSADEAKGHGKNLTFVLGDECGLWKGMGLYEGLTTGSGARREPLFVFMSTRQRKDNTPLSYLLERAKRKAAGEIDEPDFHAVVYSVPDDVEDIYDESIWPLANPALEGTCEGGFLGWEQLRRQANLAKQFPSQEQVFRLLNLNQEVGSAASLISRVDWIACEREFDERELRGRPCWVGLDLSSTTDLTAMVLFFPEDGGAVLPYFWMAEDQVKIRAREDNVPYEQYVRDGLLETTPGRAIRHRVIAKRLQQILTLYDVRAVPYDRSRSEDLMVILHDEGVEIPVVPFGQGWVSMSPAIDAFETAVLNGELCHNGHQLLSMCVGNAKAEIVDHAGNRRLVKTASRARIDGAVALVMAIGRWAKRAPEDETSRPFSGKTEGLVTGRVQPLMLKKGDARVSAA